MSYRRLHVFAVIGTFFLSAQVFALSEQEEVSYQKAKEFYSAGDFTQTCAILSTLYLEALDNSELNYYLGRCAYETGDYTSALAAYERVEMLEPGNLRIQIEHARTLYKAQLFAEAKESFESILKNRNLPENTKKSVQSYLNAIDRKEEKSRIQLSARLGFLYDSNVNFGSADDTFTILSGTFSATDPISDTAHEESAAITHLYDIGQQGNYMIRNQASIFNRRYTDEHGYDLAFLSYSPALLYLDDQNIYELTGGISRIMLGGESYYTFYSVQPSWIYKESPNLRRTLSLKAGYKNYTHSRDSDLDSRLIEARGSYAYSLSPSSSVNGTLFASRQIKNNGQRIDVNYDEFGGLVRYQNQFLPGKTIQTDISYKKRYYDDRSFMFQSYRTDQTLYGSLNYIQWLNDSISLEVGGTYNHNDSTISVYRFDKYTLSMSVSTRF